jgi:tetratricopeptide (TPR) repeat protein
MLLANQSELTGDLSYLDEALGVFDEALSVFSETETPAHWGQVQNSIGHTMLRRGDLTGHRPSIDAATDACAAALRVRSDDEMPLDWGISQINLGNAKTVLFNLTGASFALIEAVAAYCAALEVLTEDGSSRDWGLAQNGLAIALLAQAELLGDPGLAADAVAAHHQALRVRTESGANRDWAVTQMNLGIAYAVQGALARDPRITEQAVEAFKLALGVYSAELMPIDYLQTARGLGRALIRLERWHEALGILIPMSSMGSALVLAEPTRQRHRLLLKHLAGVADDMATAHLRLGNRDAALNAIAEGRGVALNLTAAIAAHADGQRLAAARSAWRVAQNVAIQAEAAVRRLEADVAKGGADGNSLISAREKASDATRAVRARFTEFRQIVADANLDRSAAMNGSDLVATAPDGGALVIPVIPSSGEAVAFILSKDGTGIGVLPLPGVSQDWITGQMDIWFRGYSRFRESLQERLAATRAAVDGWNKTMAQVLREIGARLIQPIDTVLKDGLALKQGEAEIAPSRARRRPSLARCAGE